MAESGQTPKAARLLGAAEAIRELIGMPLTKTTTHITGHWLHFEPDSTSTP